MPGPRTLRNPDTGLALHDRLLERELGSGGRSAKVRSLYGDRVWIRDLDIVNELDGHDGCVNALSWSKSGNLLASGSDDTRIHIHSYLPENSVSQFDLTTSIFTGHTQNIFSVKFMPHSNDRTIVSAAGDATVRIFDVEYSGHSARRQAASEAGLTSSVFAHTSRLNEGDTNAKVFRSHSERVKRIVTESSPFYFLTCSEDGEVRQWDLREPESSYPAPRNHFQGSLSTVPNAAVPPPLITYKRYQVDLNTISCSPSRPHYIALGGNHLHCFLHDRRMLGRDRLAERGKLASPKGRSFHDDEEMAAATQCVRRFAPHGQPRMGRTDSGHITACKISDAEPNELVVSWSSDHIYSFNIVEDPASTTNKVYASAQDRGSVTDTDGRVKESRDRKRKRPQHSSTMSLEAAERGSSKPRTQGDGSPSRDLSLRVNYGNGQREDIPLDASATGSVVPESDTRSPLPDFLTQSARIARDTVAMRKFLFRPKDISRGKNAAPPPGALAWYAPFMSSALNKAAGVMPEIEEIIKTWRYPVNPSTAEVALQRKLRHDRESAARFVQAAGTLARVIGGKLRTLGGANADAARLQGFVQVKPAPNESPLMPQRERFGYDFLRAICLWLDSGPGGLVRGFTCKPGSSRSARHPIAPEAGQDEAGIDAIDEQLIPYLLALADPSKPIIDIETNVFEVDENRVVFASERAAVLAFAQAVKIPFEDLSTGAVLPAAATAAERAAAQDRQTALKFWALRVGRGVLIEAGIEVNFHFVDTACGGLGATPHGVQRDEERLAALTVRSDGGVGESDEEVQHATVVAATGTQRAAERGGVGGEEDVDSSGGRQVEVDIPMDLLAAAFLDEGGEEISVDGLSSMSEDHEHGTDESDDNGAGYTLNDDGDDDDDDAEFEEDDDDDLELAIDGHGEASPEGDSEDESDESSDSGPHHVLFRSGRLRHIRRYKVNNHVPVSTHKRHYDGHCNVKTVKDVNFFGLGDEYVVSGSDGGHVFIWDRKTAKLVNILEGDGEVVNVVQGHPYEPMLAVSGIDHTVKIFSPDARARRDARLGIGVRKADESEFSSIQGIGLGRRRRRGRAAADPGPPAPSDPEAQARAERAEWAAQHPGSDSEEEDGQGNGPPVAGGGLSSRKRMWNEYRIRSANESEMRGNSRGEYVSRSMMQALLGRLREQMAAEEEAEGGMEVALRTLVAHDEQCATM